MPRTESSACSLISPIEQALRVVQPAGNRRAESEMLLNTIQVLRLRLPKATGYLEVAKERITVGSVIAIADSGSITKSRRTTFAALCIPALKHEVFRAKAGVKLSGGRHSKYSAAHPKRLEARSYGQTHYPRIDVHRANANPIQFGIALDADIAQIRIYEPVRCNIHVYTQLPGDSPRII